ncbi:hypothetical protein CFP56_035902 [Quercus suber]|uniref:EF-hand domain-containing protein n=1 Tax=Quercus suber TaxID=58331 RepID=A0AAW0J8H8_QUESU
MSVEVLDAATIFNFVEDEEAFNVSICDHFAHLDTDHDGLLLPMELGSCQFRWSLKRTASSRKPWTESP